METTGGRRAWRWLDAGDQGVDEEAQEVFCLTSTSIISSLR